jgi:hypothetical protein
MSCGPFVIEMGARPPHDDLAQVVALSSSACAAGAGSARAGCDRATIRGVERLRRRGDRALGVGERRVGRAAEHRLRWPD